MTYLVMKGKKSEVAFASRQETVDMQVLELASCGLPLPSPLSFFLAIPLLREAAHCGQYTPITVEGFTLLEQISQEASLSSSVRYISPHCDLI